jgi:hypothetical protein
MESRFCSTCRENTKCFFDGSCVSCFEKQLKENRVLEGWK